MFPTWKRRSFALLQTALILGLSYSLRTCGGEWDQGQLLHPDERFLCMVVGEMGQPASLAEFFDTDSSPLNPHNLGKGRFVYGTLPVFLVQVERLRQGVDDLNAIAGIGRRQAALWSTGTVLVLFLFAARIGGIAFGNLTALWLALTVLPIQQAHFFTVDSAALFFSTAVLALGTLALKEQKNAFLFAAAAMVGLAMACRLNLGLLGVWLVPVTLALAWKTRDKRPLLRFLEGALLSLLLFRIAQPYAFAAGGFLPRGLNSLWLEELRMEYAIVTGALEVPYILQWVNRIPGLYPLHQAMAWGMGWPLGLLAVAGSLGLLWTLRHQPGHWLFLLLLWPLLLFGYHSRFFLQTLRYFLPAYPVLILGGGLALRRFPLRSLRRLLATVVTAATAVYAIAFVNIHREDPTRVRASEWLIDHLPNGGIVTYEIWDRELPLHLPDRLAELSRIYSAGLPVYDPESPEKLETILSTIDRADFVVLSSTHVSLSIPRFPMRYPMMTRFYEDLESGALGLEEVARFQTLPRFGPFTFNSLRAEEAFHLYDHPLVRVYRRTPQWDVERARNRLSRGIDFEAIPDIRFTDAGRWNGGWLTPEQWERRRGAPRFQERFHPQSTGVRSPLPVWLLVLFFLGVVNLPLSMLLLPSLADRGFFSRRLLALLLVAYVSWLLASLERMDFAVAVGLSMLLLCLVNGFLFAFYQERMRLVLRRHWKTLAFGEAVWWAVFALFLLLRWFQPELWHPWSGGEKPMDYAFLNATAHARVFPPVQPWLAGGFLNYYYYGFVLVSVLIHLTGIPPAIAYNLALPTFAAFTAGTIMSLAATLTPLLRIRPGIRGLKRTGLLAVLFTLVLGNLAQLRWLLFERGGHPRDAYWNASRALRVPEGAVAPITEFPFFSFLYGDLHAHVMALPLAVLTLLASWQLLRRFHPLRILLSALLLGSLHLTNAWDVPIQAAILLFALFSPVLRVPASARPATAWTSLGWSALALGLSRLLFLPFHRISLSYPARFLFWDGPRSRPVDLLLHHGMFLIPILLCGIPLLREPRLRHAPRIHRLFPILLFAGCLVLVVFLEFFTLDGDIGRMNTVFKFYYQIWWILAVLCALVIRAALQTLRHPEVAGVSLLVLGLGLLYPFTATPAKLRERVWASPPNGLDGEAYLKTAVWHTPEGDPMPLSDDLRVIQWLREHADPVDILLEAQRPEYQWGGRISWHTGMPAVLGWNWHMRQQRPRPGADAVVWRRAADVERIYRGRDPEHTLSLLRRHKVRWVIFSELERVTYGGDSRDFLESHPHLRPVFRYGTGIIYEVLP